MNPAIRSFRQASARLLLPLLFAAPCLSQSSSSSSSGADKANTAAEQSGPVARPRIAQIEAGGSAVTLETSESLFDLAVALNACGYDADLSRSAPVRGEVRAELNANLTGSEEARTSRDELCKYVTQHQLSDSGLNVGQYVSLSLYLSPPPELTPNVPETDLPPQAAQVVNVLPLLRTFVEEAKLHLIWLHHRAEYEALVERVHDPMTRAILNTNIYLHQPVSSYDGRRFLVLLEPMLSPNLTNARIYGFDYIIVTSPDNTAGDPVRMDQIRHIYLHYVIEPMVYSRGSAMERIQPMMRGVQDAPLDFFYKSDVVALMTESLIKAVEARTYETAAPKPKKPSSKERAAGEQYAAEKDLYDRETTAARDKQVAIDEEQGWVLTGYFYRALQGMEKNGDGLRDEIAPMIYTMDVDGERRHAEQIQFAKTSSADPLGRAPAVPRQLSVMDQAEMSLAKGDVNKAADLAEKVNADPNGDHGRALYTLARIDLMQRDPDKASAEFEEALKKTKDPRTIAWSHIYLGRLYDSSNPPDREHAVAEYKAALANRDSRPDTKIAAENGIKKPFALPQREAKPRSEDDANFDPTGKAEKDAYKPEAPAKTEAPH